MANTPHPDYLSVEEGRRWGKPLAELYPTLRAEAWKLKGKWAWRVLPHGALVSLRIVPPEESGAFHTELRLARKTSPPDTPEGWQKWNLEVQTFLKYLKVEGDWQETRNLQSENKADVTMRFKMRGETSAAAAGPKCARCGAPEIIQPGLFKEDLCRACAIELGNKDIAAKQAAAARADA